MTSKNKYNCHLLNLINEGYGFRARVEMLEDHKALGGSTREITVTSAIKTIDFVNGIIITQNSIYQFQA